MQWQEEQVTWECCRAGLRWKNSMETNSIVKCNYTRTWHYNNDSYLFCKSKIFLEKESIHFFYLLSARSNLDSKYFFHKPCRQSDFGLEITLESTKCMEMNTSEVHDLSNVTVSSIHFFRLTITIIECYYGSCTDILVWLYNLTIGCRLLCHRPFYYLRKKQRQQYIVD